MRKKLFVILIILGFINVAGFSTLLLLTTVGPSYNFDYEPINLGPELRKNELSINFDSLKTSSALRTADPGDVKYWLINDHYLGQPFFSPFLLMAQGDIAEVWVQSDLSWPSGDPRAKPIITQDQVDYLLYEFENIIYPNETDCFGMPDFHDGTYSLLEMWGYFPPGYYYDSMGRNVILVSNIRDENYYDPGYPDHVEGLYYSDFEKYFDRNVISIDSYDWENRIGPNVQKPYLYEGILAHEYQHLIHDDYIQPDEPWMNEGCSMFAEILCGYPPDWRSINSFFATPDNSLTEWEDQGKINIWADYGQAFLWVTYLFDNYEGILKDYFANHVPGIEGLNAIFPESTNFDEVFRKWRIDNLLKRNYDSLDLKDPAAYDIRVYDWTDENKGTDFGNTITILGYDTGISKLGTYGTDYIKFSGFDEEVKFSFDGDDDVPMPSWIYNYYYWYTSTRGESYNDLQILYNVNPHADTTLTFDTYYDMQDYYDYGFVQVSYDGGETWNSLANEYTTDLYDPNLKWDAIIDNLPGLTGWSSGFFQMKFDLPASTEPYLLGFRYMTDIMIEYEGWYITNVKIGGVPLDDSKFFPPIQETDFTVDFVIFKEDKGELEVEDIIELSLNDLTEVGTKWLDLDNDEFCIVIVSMNPGLGDYEFSIMEEDDDQDPPLLTIEAVDCFSDGESGVWSIVAEDESGLYEIGLTIDGMDYTFTQADFGMGMLVELLIPIDNELGVHSCEGYAIDADLDRGFIDQLETVHPPVYCVINDDDMNPPILPEEFFTISDTIHEISISLKAIDVSGISKAIITIDNEFTVIFNELLGDVFTFLIENYWNMDFGIHYIEIEVWDADDDRIEDSMFSMISGTFETSLEEIKQYVIWSLDQLIQEIQDSPDDCWRKKNDKATMINKLNDLQDLISENCFEEAYDKLLHDIKPKLTGLKTDQNEIPWGNGIFKDPWVIACELQEVFQLICNDILSDITILISNILGHPLLKSILSSLTIPRYNVLFLLGIISVISIIVSKRVKKS